MADLKLIVDSCVFIDAFDPRSGNHADALHLLQQLSARHIRITMPAHGWFEVQCALRKLEAEKRFEGPEIAGKMQFELELLHIDDAFIKKYQMVDIPHLKAGDHIFAVVARHNDYPLITSDAQMIRVGRECGIRVFQPTEFVAQLEE